MALLQLFVCFHLTDHLGHGAHGTEAAPGSGFEQGVYNQTNNGRGQHQTVKSETELGDPVRRGAGGVSPSPGDAEHPQQLERFLQTVCAGGHQICLEDHVAEHAEEEDQKSVAKPFSRKESWSQCVS